ncbi:hypothetical protein CW304_19025 [Bacillus sp. UFRGS-B20]|nr:hypothetical protein CW304_19025 [Bacillus sp. UFRGS-B20]
MKEKFEFGQNEFKFSITCLLYFTILLIEWFLITILCMKHFFLHILTLQIPSYYCICIKTTHFTISQDCHCYFLNSISNEGQNMSILHLFPYFMISLKNGITSPRNV